MYVAHHVDLHAFNVLAGRLQGSVFITYRAQTFLRGLAHLFVIGLWLTEREATLANSKYGNEETLHRIVDIFDKTNKLQFRRADEPQYIQFGLIRDKEPEYNIRSGQLKLSGLVTMSIEELGSHNHAVRMLLSFSSHP